MEYGEIAIWWLGSVALGLALGYAVKWPKEGALWTLLLGVIGLGIFVLIAAWGAINRPSPEGRRN
jgi:membrane protein DedA with SNARE-associated domain